ncbi:MAG: glycosyltransferase involved in cell wall biosynthesis, partial [Bacteroidia bacterium]
ARLKRAIVSVINDLSTDQRVHKHCMLLSNLGYDVLLIGRQKSDSIPLDKRPYNTHRMQLPFEKGPLFYACYNLALFLNLLTRKSSLLFSNDLDTLLPNFLASRILGGKLIYDSHEFFTEVPELVSRPRVQSIWKKLEYWILPKLKNTLTVNGSIAGLYKQEYGADMLVVRNIPSAVNQSISKKSRTELGLPENKKLIILQGSGINVDRGAEESVEAMQYLENAVLLIIGSGDVIPDLKQRVIKLNLKDRVLFKDRMPYQEMMAHTNLADLGLTLDKDTNINYRFSLPNKVFDYIHAGIPVLASNLVEVKKVVEEFDFGEIAANHNPKDLARKIDEMLKSDKVEFWKANSVKASKELSWEKETELLKSMIEKIDG